MSKTADSQIEQQQAAEVAAAARVRAAGCTCQTPLVGWRPVVENAVPRCRLCNTEAPPTTRIEQHANLHAAAPRARQHFDITPEQCHAGLDKLWAAMPDLQGPQDEDAFTIAARRLSLNAELLEALEAIVELAFKPAMGRTSDSVIADKWIDKARAAIAKATK